MAAEAAEATSARSWAISSSRAASRAASSAAAPFHTTRPLLRPPRAPPAPPRLLRAPRPRLRPRAAAAPVAAAAPGAADDALGDAAASSFRMRARAAAAAATSTARALSAAALAATSASAVRCDTRAHCRAGELDFARPEEAAGGAATRFDEWPLVVCPRHRVVAAVVLLQASRLSPGRVRCCSLMISCAVRAFSRSAPESAAAVELMPAFVDPPVEVASRTSSLSRTGELPPARFSPGCGERSCVSKAARRDRASESVLLNRCLLYAPPPGFSCVRAASMPPRSLNGDSCLRCLSAATDAASRSSPTSYKRKALP